MGEYVGMIVCMCLYYELYKNLIRYNNLDAYV